MDEKEGLNEYLAAALTAIALGMALVAAFG